MSASGMHARNGKARTPFWRVSASNKKGLARLQMVSALSGMSGGAGGMRRPAVCMGWLQRGVYPPIDILLHFACIWTSYLTLFALRNFFYITFFPSHKILSPYHPYLLWGTSEMKSFPTETLFFWGSSLKGDGMICLRKCCWLRYVELLAHLLIYQNVYLTTTFFHLPI